MLFKRFTEIILCVLIIIIGLEFINLILNWNISFYLIIGFCLVIAFDLGAGFCRYKISDTLCEK